MKINSQPEVKDIELSEINPAVYNPREIGESAYAGLKHSLEKFGVVDLLVINKRNMRIISGHQRYKILKEDGAKSTKAIVVDVDELTEKAMNITLNSQEIVGQWTEAIVPLLEELRKADEDGYVSLKLDQLRADLSEFEQEKTGKTLPDDIPGIPGKDKITTNPGDLWLLGEHRLLCGDSTNEEDVKYLMDGKKASLFATDPPYCIDYTGKDHPNGGKDWTDVYREIDIPDSYEFMKQFFQVGLKQIHDNTAIYLWHASRKVCEISAICEELKLLIHQHIVWSKPCVVLTYSFYGWSHENCLMMWVKGKNPQYKAKDKGIGTVLRLDYVTSEDAECSKNYGTVWELGWEGKKRSPDYEHPTIKPTEVFAIPMRVHTKVGDICYEPFSGSGSQIIAGERLNRKVYGMELEPAFCDVAVKRWEEFTGKKAEVIKAGKNKQK